MHIETIIAEVKIKNKTVETSTDFTEIISSHHLQVFSKTSLRLLLTTYYTNA